MTMMSLALNQRFEMGSLTLFNSHCYGPFLRAQVVATVYPQAVEKVVPLTISLLRRPKVFSLTLVPNG